MFLISEFGNPGNRQRQQFLKNQMKNSRITRVRNGGKPMKNKPRRMVNKLSVNRKRNTLTVEKLNQDLDGYMNNNQMMF